MTVETFPGVRRSFRSGRYRFEWPEPERAILELDMLRPGRDGEVTAEVTATSTAPATGGTVHVARVNLLSTRSLSEYARQAAQRTGELPTDWSRLLAIAARDTVELHRRGKPAVLLADVQRPPDAGMLLPPLLVGRMPTILFGDGGSAKSLLALAAAASIVTGRPHLGLTPATTHRVGFLDYEMDGWAHRERLARLTGEPLPEIVYIECARPLVDDVDRIRRIVEQQDLGFLVVDSVALASDGPPEAAEVASRFFGALRELGLGSLLVAHVNRSGDTERPFGSAFWHNGCRLSWYVKRESDLGSSAVAVGLFNKKSNTGPLAPPLGYTIDFGDRIRIERTGGLDIPDIASHVPLSYRVSDAIRTGARTVADISSDLEADVDTVARTLRRMREKGRAQQLTGPDGVVRWGLSERVG